ncbi:MAG TPA: hypothetical protein VMS11_10415 [Solirubrobacterales bacterium]|nr:hypothetical protein [Solirubrobacterales bacterium]
MGWRERLESRVEQGVAQAQSQARAIAASDTVQNASEGFRGFREMLADDGGPLKAEAYLLALVRAVREDEEEDRSQRDLYVRARKRRRRLGLISFGAGPMVGVASRVADLYCETATVCDVADFHDLGLDERQIGAQMLLFWSISDDLARAEAALRSEPPLVNLLTLKLAESSDVSLDGDLTRQSIVTALWEIQRMDLTDKVADAKRAAKGEPIRSVAFTGHRTKKLIRKAEAQLGVNQA